MADTVSSATSSVMGSPPMSPEPPLSPPSTIVKAPIELAPPKTGMTPPATPEGMSRMQAKRLGISGAEPNSSTHIEHNASQRQAESSQHPQQQPTQQQLLLQLQQPPAAQPPMRKEGAAATSSGTQTKAQPNIKLVQSHGVTIEVAAKPLRRNKTVTEKMKERQQAAAVEAPVVAPETDAEVLESGAVSEVSAATSAPVQLQATAAAKGRRMSMAKGRRMTVAKGRRMSVAKSKLKFSGTGALTRLNIMEEKSGDDQDEPVIPKPKPPPWTPIEWDDEARQRVQIFFKKLRSENTDGNRVDPTEVIPWFFAARHPDVVLKRKTPMAAFEAFLKNFRVSKRGVVTSRDFLKFTTSLTQALSMEELQKHYGTLDDLVRQVWCPVAEDISQQLMHDSQESVAGALLSAARDRVVGVSPYLNSPNLAPPSNFGSDVAEEEEAAMKGTDAASISPLAVVTRNDVSPAAYLLEEPVTPRTPLPVAADLSTTDGKKSPMDVMKEWHFSEHQDLGFPMRMVEHHEKRVKIMEEFEGGVEVGDTVKDTDLIVECDDVQPRQLLSPAAPSPTENERSSSDSSSHSEDEIPSPPVSSGMRSPNQGASGWRRGVGSPRRGSVLHGGSTPKMNPIGDIQKGVTGVIEEDDEDASSSSGSSSTSSSSPSHQTVDSSMRKGHLGEQLYAGIRQFDEDERLVKIIIHEGAGVLHGPPLFLSLKGECLSTGDIARLMIYPHDWTASTLGALKVLEPAKRTILARWVYDHLTIMPSTVGKGLVLGIDNSARNDGPGRPKTPPGDMSPRAASGAKRSHAFGPPQTPSPRTPVRKGRRRMSTFAGAPPAEDKLEAASNSLVKSYSDEMLRDKVWCEMQMTRPDSVVRKEAERRKKATIASEVPDEKANDATRDFMELQGGGVSSLQRYENDKRNERGETAAMDATARWRWAIFRILKHRRLIRMTRAMMKSNDDDGFDMDEPEENDHIIHAAVDNAMKIAAFSWEKQEENKLKFQEEFGKMEEDDVQQALAALEARRPGERTFGDMEACRLALAHIEFFRKIEAQIPHDVSKLLQHSILIQAPSLEELFCQGEEADGMYIIIMGSVDVFVTRTQTVGLESKTTSFKVATLEAGETFGEGGLVEKKPRAATIVTAEASQLIFIPSKVFMDTLHKSQVNEAREIRNVLGRGSVTGFLLRNQRVIGQILAGASMRLFRTGSVICRQGDPSQHIFIIKSGEVRLMMQREDGHGNVYAGEALELEPRLHTGACFGAALLDNSALQKIINGVAEGTHISNYRDSNPAAQLHHTLSVIAVTELHVLELQLSQVEQLAPRMYAQLMSDYNTKYRRYYAEPSEWVGLRYNEQMWCDLRTYLVNEACKPYGYRKHFEDNHHLVPVHDKFAAEGMIGGKGNDQNVDPLGLDSDNSVSTITVQFESLATANANAYKMLRADFHKPLPPRPQRTQGQFRSTNKDDDSHPFQELKPRREQKQSHSSSAFDTPDQLSKFRVNKNQSYGTPTLRTGGHLNSGIKKSSVRRQFAWNSPNDRHSAHADISKTLRSADKQRDALRPDYSGSGILNRPGSTSAVDTNPDIEVKGKSPSITIARASGVEGRLQKLLNTDSTLVRQPIKNDRRFTSVLRPSSAPNSAKNRRRRSSKDNAIRPQSATTTESAREATHKHQLLQDVSKRSSMLQSTPIGEQFPFHSRPQSAAHGTRSRSNQQKSPSRPQSAPSAALRKGKGNATRASRRLKMAGL